MDLKPTKAQVRTGLERSLPDLADDAGTRKPVIETFSLLEGFSSGSSVPVYTSGEAVSLSTSYETIVLRTDGTARMTDGIRGRRTFKVRSQITEPNLAKLSNAPGLTRPRWSSGKTTSTQHQLWGFRRHDEPAPA
jgi:hypothetical protein